jgi:hypothetical protein
MSVAALMVAGSATFWITCDSLTRYTYRFLQFLQLRIDVSHCSCPFLAQSFADRGAASSHGEETSS